MLKRYFIFTIMAMFFILLAGTDGFSHEPGFTITIPQTIAPPKIDGVPDDVIWKLAPEAIVDNINIGGKVKEDQISRVKAVYDTDNIYVIFINFRPDPENAQAEHKAHDSDVWKDEENEVFIDVEHDGAAPYYHIMVNIANVTYDQQKGGAERGWEAKGLETATKIYKAEGYWVLEMKIPFIDLGIKETPIGETWGWNFNRHIVPPDIWTSWATTGPSFHTPSRFGDLIFGEEKLSVNPSGKIAICWGSLKR